jgi:hypothetical protein
MTSATQQILNNITQPGAPAVPIDPDPNIASANIADVYAYEQDTNRLARGISTGTVVDTKDTARRTDIRTALSIDTWSEPESPFGASYPHNQVRQTPNGLIEEFDDTPGNIRYHRYHPSGTYTEIDDNGTEVRKIVGDNYYIVENNGNIFIGGSASVTVSSTCRILVLGDASIEVGGKLSAVVKSDVSLTASGSMNLNVGETLNIKADNIVMESTKFNQTVVGTQKVKAGAQSTEVVGAVNTKVGGDLNLQATNLNTTTTVDTKMTSANFSVLSSGEILQTATGAANIKGADIKLQGTLHITGSIKASTTQKETQGDNLYPVSTTGPSAPVAATAAAVPNLEAPENTNLVLPSGRSEGSNITAPTVPRPNSRIQRAAIENDGRAEPVATNLYPGYSSGAPYVSPSQSAPSTTPIPNVPVTETDNRFLNTTSPPYDQLISQHVRLKDVSVNARARGHQIISQRGLTVGQIITNLQALSINVIDKLIETYGSTVIISSGFRQESSSRSTSQHATGQAVDIQFSNLRPADYAARAAEVMALVPFDQFILEYQSGGSGNPWLHISFSQSSNRRQYFTMRNHQRVTEVRVA